MAGLRELGKTGVKINPLGLGCMGMCNGIYGPADDTESTKVLDRAIELGCTFWDTADVYGSGHSEKLLGQTLKANRDKVFLSTKCGCIFNYEKMQVTVNGTPEYIKNACAKSLERLGVDTIDLYYLHRIDINTPIEESMKAMAELVKEGKIKYVGLSECSGETLRRAYKVHPVAAVQVEYSPWYLGIEADGLLDAARELGVSIVAYSPLGRGFLTGTIKSLDDIPENDHRRAAPRFFPENFQKNLDLVKKIEELAAKKGVSMAGYVLAWVLAQGEDFIVIPGTKKIQYLEQNFQGGQLELTKEEVAEMRKIVIAAAPQGDRYPESEMGNLSL